MSMPHSRAELQTMDSINRIALALEKIAKTLEMFVENYYEEDKD